jgi:hypothetical protein
MGADAIHVVALGLDLLPIYAVVVATLFCRRALRDGGEFEAEIKAPAFAAQLRAKGPAARVQGRDETGPRTRRRKSRPVRPAKPRTGLSGRHETHDIVNGGLRK